MATNLVKKENATAVVTAVAEKNEWKDAQAKAFQKIKSKLKLKGFRSGAAIPDGLAKPHINDADVLNEAINIILPALYEAALKENELVPFLQPSVSVTKVSNEEIEVSFEIPLYPEVKLGNYKGIKVELDSYTVEDAEVEASIRLLANKNADLVVAEEGYKAAKGDTVVFDFKGFVGDKQFEGGSAENYSLELGSNTFVPGFEDQLIGVTAGADVDVNVTFPTQYVKELAGKDATFKCKIHEIKTKQLPEVNDDFAKELNIEGVDSVETLKAHQKADLAGKKERSAKAKQFNTLVATIVENSEISLGDKILEREVSAMKEDIVNRVTQNGLTLEQYLELTNNTEESLDNQLRTDAKRNLATFLTLSKIAEVENLAVTDADLEHELEEMGQQYNMTVEKIKEVLGENIGRVRSEIQNKKIEEFLKANNL